MFMKGDQILSAFSNLLLLFVFCLFFAACGMNILRVSSRSDSKNVTSAFKEPVEIADEEPDSRRRSCAHTKESANKECLESSDRKQQQQQQQPSTSSNSDQTATADNNFAEAFKQPNINGAKRLSYEMRSEKLSSKKRESFQVTPEGFELERVRATISAFERGEADSHDVFQSFGFGLDLSSVGGINQRYRAIFRVIHPDKLKSEDAEQLSVALQDAKKAAVEELQRRERTAKRDAATADAGAASKSAGEAEKRNAAEPAATEPAAMEMWSSRIGSI